MNKADIIHNMEFKSHITHIIMLIMNDVEDASYDDIMKKYREINKNIEELHGKIYNDHIYSNKDMLEMCETSIEYKRKPVMELLESIDKPEKVDIVIEKFKKDKEYYNSILEILIEIAHLYNLLSYFQTYELISEYFHGENMEYHAENGNYLYVIIVWFIIFYDYYCNAKNHKDEYRFDEEFCTGFITGSFTSMYNDKENYRDIPGAIEITKELNIINDEQYNKLKAIYNEISHKN